MKKFIDIDLDLVSEWYINQMDGLIQKYMW
jgi:hypothetical protein